MACLLLTAVMGCGGGGDSSAPPATASTDSGQTPAVASGHGGEANAAESGGMAGGHGAPAGMSDAMAGGSGHDAAGGTPAGMSDAMVAGNSGHGAPAGAPGGAMAADAGHAAPAGMSEMMAAGHGAPGSEMAAMEMMSPQYGTNSPAGYGQPASGAGGPGRPQDPKQWTDDQILAAVAERDPRVQQAILARAAATPGDESFPLIMEQALQVSVGGSSMSGPGGPIGSMPDLFQLFGGGGRGGSSGGSAPVELTVPRNLPKTPPGGAFQQLNPRRFRKSPLHALDSLDAMLGEAVLGYTPQAEQGVRGAAENLQNGVQNPGLMSPGSPGHGAPSVDMSTAGAPEGYPGGEMSGYEGLVAPGRQNAGAQLSDRDLLQTILQALVLNNSKAAWKMIDGIASGTVSTPGSDGDSAASLILTALGAPDITPELATKILEKGVRVAEEDPEGGGLAQAALSSVSQKAVDHFLKLAPRHPPGGPRPPGQPPGPGMGPPGYPMSAPGMTGSSIPGQPTPAGYPGQPGMDPSMMEGGYGMGGSGGQGQPPLPPSALPGVHVSEAAMPAVASTLWSSQTADFVVSELDRGDSTDGVALVAFAANFPSDRVRHALYGLLQRSYDGGNRTISSPGFFRHDAHDPGFLTVMKSLPRERPTKPATPAPNPNAQQYAGEGGPMAAAPPVVADTPAESWVMGTREVLLSLRDRLRGAADDPSLQYDGLPRIRLHPNAEAEKSIMIQVGGDQNSATGDISETTVYYASCRITVQRESEAQKILDYYEKRIKAYVRPDMSMGLMWFDGVKANSEDGTRESLDVLIEQVGNRPGGQYGGESGFAQQQPGGQAGPQFLIETIAVVVRDPQSEPK
ncbi:MAG: hypothetical protein R3C49_26100 [Planctomycetaceae bacterium]